jgi:hypothetical protein
MSVGPRPLQHTAPHDEVCGVPVRIDRGVARPRHSARGTGHYICPSLRREETFARKQRRRDTKGGVRTRKEGTGLESRRPIAAKHALPFGEWRLVALPRRYSQIEDGFPVDHDVDRPVHDLGTESRRTRAVRLERRTATWKSIETIAARGVGNGVP